MASYDKFTMYHKMFMILATISVVTDSRVLGVDQQPEDVVEYACKHTLYYVICESSLRSDPRSNTSDIVGLVGVALDLSIIQARQMLTQIQVMKINGRSNSSSYESECLDDCLDVYSDALDDLNESTHALTMGDYDTVNQMVSGSMADGQTCEDGLEDGNDGNGSSPLTHGNQYFYQLCSNVLAIANLV